MPDSINFTLTHDNRHFPLRLYGEGAIYWPEWETLFITDPHFGKSDSFRHAGIAIPTSILDHDLARLTRLLTQTLASNLVVLGDFFHTRHSQSESALLALDSWRRQHPKLEIVLVQGNHDLHAGPPPAEFNIHTVPAPFVLGPFACHHQPIAKASGAQGYILAGHLHPYVVMHGRDGSRMRLAAFVFGPHQAILPAFGAFTGGSHYAPAAHDRVFAIAHHEIVEVPTTWRRTSSAPP
jgi:DNA ligase-associated metallophosphoesterase